MGRTPILRVGCPSYNLTSRISALMHKPSAQIPEAFGETIKYLGSFNTAKRLILFQEAVTKFSQKCVGCMGGGIPMGHDNKIVRPSSSYMINRTRLNFENHQFLGLQVNTLC